MTNFDQISTTFTTFAERECKGVSRLYHQLSLDISAEKELLRIANKSRKRQPIPNLFLGAIHYLLMKNPEEELAAYYPSISKQASSEIPIKLVKEFCKRREEEIVSLLQEKIVQTNAINRSAYLMPIISSRYSPNGELSLVDIGTSSGLTMNLDKYEYDYGEGQKFGKSQVKIKSKLLGGKLPDFKEILKINRKIGIDQNPLDLTHEDNATWLTSLIWPDSLERFERIKSAIALAKEASLELYQASSVGEFKKIIDKIPLEGELMVFHTHVLYQFSQAERREFRDMLDVVGEKRNYTYVAVESNSVFDRPDYPTPGIKIEVTAYEAGNKFTKIIGETDGHANWIRWLA